MPSSADHPPVLTLEQARDIERGGRRLQLRPSVLLRIPEGTPAEQTLVAMRANVRRQWVVVAADAADQPSDEELGVLQADPMLPDAQDMLTLETCDRCIQEIRARCDLALPLILNPARIAARTGLLGAPREQEFRQTALGNLRDIEHRIVAIRHQWEGSLYHQFIRDRHHTGQHREAFRTEMTADYARILQALEYVEQYASIDA